MDEEDPLKEQILRKGAGIMEAVLSFDYEKAYHKSVQRERRS